MKRKLISFITILTFTLTGCSNVIINNTNNPPPSDEEVTEKVQPEKNDSEKSKDPSEGTNSEEKDKTGSEETDDPSGKNDPEAKNNIDNEDFQKASEIADKIYETYQITRTNAILRENASAEASALEEIPAGKKLYVKGATVDTNTYEIWCKVEYNSMEGYISYKSFNPDYSL